MNSNNYKTHWIILFAAIFFNPAINFAQVEGECDSLISPCENTFSLNGFYIDLEAVSGNILIHSFHTLTQNGGARNVDLYYKAGKYLGAEGDPLLWNLVGSTNDFAPQFGPSCPLPYTEIPIVAYKLSILLMVIRIKRRRTNRASLLLVDMIISTSSTSQT
ncbi:MAG: hypothetical protein ABIV51_02695, partial [Saprospiraceae bacterium]